MTGREYKQARVKLKLSVDELAAITGEGKRTIYYREQSGRGKNSLADVSVEARFTIAIIAQAKGHVFLRDRLLDSLVSDVYDKLNLKQ